MLYNFIYNVVASCYVNDAGVAVDRRPFLAAGDQVTWRVAFRDADNAPLDLTGISVWRTAVAQDVLSSTPVMTRTVDAGIAVDLDAGAVSVDLDATVDTFTSVVDGVTRKAAYYEIIGLDAAGKRVFRERLDIWAGAVVDPVVAPDAPGLPDLVATQDWVIAKWRAGFEYQFAQTSTGADAHTVQTSADRYYRQRAAAVTGADWSDWFSMVQGPQGEPGAVLTSAHTVTFTVTADDTTAERVFTLAELGVSAQCGWELIAPDGSVTVCAMQWVNNCVLHILCAGGFAVGTWTLLALGVKGDQGVPGPVRPVFYPTFWDATYGSIGWLDATRTTISTTGAVFGVTKVRLQVLSADATITGDIAITVAGQSFTVAVGATLATVTLTLSSAFTGLLSLARDTTSVADSLKDGDTAITAIVADVEVCYE